MKGFQKPLRDIDLNTRFQNFDASYTSLSPHQNEEPEGRGQQGNGVSTSIRCSPPPHSRSMFKPPSGAPGVAIYHRNNQRQTGCGRKSRLRRNIAIWWPGEAEHSPEWRPLSWIGQSAVSDRALPARDNYKPHRSCKGWGSRPGAWYCSGLQ